MYAGSTAAVGLVFFLVNIRQVEFAQFSSDAGAYSFNVARAGPKAEEFGHFVALIEEQIRKAKGSPPPPPA